MPSRVVFGLRALASCLPARFRMRAVCPGRPWPLPCASCPRCPVPALSDVFYYVHHTRQSVVFIAVTAEPVRACSRNSTGVYRLAAVKKKLEGALVSVVLTCRAPP